MRLPDKICFAQWLACNRDSKSVCVISLPGVVFLGHTLGWDAKCPQCRQALSTGKEATINQTHSSPSYGKLHQHVNPTMSRKAFAVMNYCRAPQLVT